MDLGSLATLSTPHPRHENEGLVFGPTLIRDGVSFLTKEEGIFDHLWDTEGTHGWD